MSASSPVAVYIHIPFCPSKCGYCDFNSYALTGDIVEQTCDAIEQEIVRSPHRGRACKTIFFGGGTPTYIPTDRLCRILQLATECHPPTAHCEITSEANPGTITKESLSQMRAAGFNRLSIGAQSFNTSDLIRLGRVHDAPAIGQAIEASRAAGFTNVNIDLMFSLPGQSKKAWKSNLDLAIQCRTEHVSLYGLTIEQNTRFFKFFQRGLLNLPDEEDQVAMYNQAVEDCESNQLQQYEISNFSKAGLECQHNLAYWRNEEYYAYGPGAVSSEDFQGGRKRTTRLKSPHLYCERVEQGGAPVLDVEILTPDIVESERIMMGLRLNEGVTPPINKKSEIEKFIKLGFLKFNEDRICLTEIARPVSNRIIMELM